MEIFLGILSQLKINSSTLHFLVLFLVTFFALKAIVFEPYFAAFVERERRTRGSEDSAKELHQEIQTVKAHYEVEARDLNSEVKSIFDENRKAASAEYNRVVTEARKNADTYLEKMREQISAEITKANNQLSGEIPSVAQAITKKMLN